MPFRFVLSRHFCLAAAGANGRVDTVLPSAVRKRTSAWLPPLFQNNMTPSLPCSSSSSLAHQQQRLTSIRCDEHFSPYSVGYAPRLANPLLCDWLRAPICVLAAAMLTQNNMTVACHVTTGYTSHNSCRNIAATANKTRTLPLRHFLGTHKGDLRLLGRIQGYDHIFFSIVQHCCIRLGTLTAHVLGSNKTFGYFPPPVHIHPYGYMKTSKLLCCCGTTVLHSEASQQLQRDLHYEKSELKCMITHTHTQKMTCQYSKIFRTPNKIGGC